MDPDILSRSVKQAGFDIEFCEFVSRDDYPKEIRMDGRENVGLIAKKPPGKT